MYFSPFKYSERVDDNFLLLMGQHSYYIYTVFFLTIDLIINIELEK